MTIASSSAHTLSTPASPALSTTSPAAPLRSPALPPLPRSPGSTAPSSSSSPRPLQCRSSASLISCSLARRLTLVDDNQLLEAALDAPALTLPLVPYGPSSDPTIVTTPACPLGVLTWF
eukprot:632112-Hanusia_phi.AAC.2